MLVFDTSLLLDAATEYSDFREPWRRLLERTRRDPAPAFLTWSVCYEFLRVSTYPRVLKSPWTTEAAVRFTLSLLGSLGFQMLVATLRHAAMLTRTVKELPDVRGSVFHDLHTAVLMLEHGISRVCTRDDDSCRFPFLTVVDPLSVSRYYR